jgi:sugar lactone lactonase YvrE
MSLALLPHSGAPGVASEPSANGAAPIQQRPQVQQSANPGGLAQQAALKPEPLALRQQDFPLAVVDQVFEASVQALGGSGIYRMTVNGTLPPGLAVQGGAATIGIGGVPTTSGIYDFQISVTDTTGTTVNHDYQINVQPRLFLPPVSISDSETFQFTDIDFAHLPVTINAFETFHLSDSPVAQLAIRIQAAESFHFTDTEPPFLPGQTITFPALPSPITVGSSYPLYATSSSGLPITYAASGFAFVTGNIFTVYGPGRVSVYAEQAGNSAYAPAATVSQTFTAVSGTVVTAAPVMQIVPGQLSTLAGQGSSFCEDCLATSTTLGDPEDIVVDSAGNVYFSDSNTATVQKIASSTGIITNIAGSFGRSGGEDVKPRFLHRTAAERAAHRADPAAANAALAAAQKTAQSRPMVGPQPNQQGTSVSLYDPVGMAVDANGDIFFADEGANVVYEVTPNGAISIVAGIYNSNGYSGDNGPATSARLSDPLAVAVDSAGNLYIADTGNALIRKVNTSGVISTFAGMHGGFGSAGDGGPATSATLSYPAGVAVDPFGNVYLSDDDLCIVRKVNTAGVISTIAGNANQSNLCSDYKGDDGPAAQADLYDPGLLHTDAAGNLYIADGTAVRKIDTSGIIRDVAGTEVMQYNNAADPTGPATGALIGYVGGASTDSAGNLYIGLNDISYVVKAGPSSAVSFGTVAPGSSSQQVVTLANAGPIPLTFSAAPTLTGSGFAYQPLSPYSCTFSTALAPGASCDLLVTFAPTSGGTFSGTLSIGDNATNSPQVVSLSGTALNPKPRLSLSASATTVIVGNPVTLTAVAGPVVSGGPMPTGTLQLFNGTASIATQTLDNTGTAVFNLTSLPVGAYGFSVAYAGDSNYQATSTNSTVNVSVYPATSGGAAAAATLQIVPGLLSTLSGQGSTFCEGCTATSTQLSDPGDIVVDNAGNVYFADGGTETVQMISASTGIITNIAGMNADAGGGGDLKPVVGRARRTPQERAAHRANPAAANAAQFAAIAAARSTSAIHPGARVSGSSVNLGNPQGMAVDASGDVFFADAEAEVVYEVTPDGTISIVAGTLNNYGYSGDGGPATSAKLSYPLGVALDAAGNLYIADTDNAIVRKVNTSGIINTVAGTPQRDGDTGDGGPATSAQLSYPIGVAVDPFGNIFIADNDYCVVRKVDTSGNISTIAGGASAEACENFAGDGGPASAAVLYDPTFLHTDLAGSLYISDGTSVRKIDTSGIIRLVAGNEETVDNSYDDPQGPAVPADLGYLGGASTDNAGNLYIGLSDYAFVIKAGPSSTIALGSQQIGSTANQTLTLSNSGTLPLTFPSGPALTGTAFTVSPFSPYGCSFPLTLAPGNSCDLNIAFTPTSAGLFAGTLAFSDNASTSPQIVALSGTGALPTPTLTLTPSGFTLIAGNSLTLSASVSATGGPTPTGTVQLLNGTASLGTQTLSAGSTTFNLTSLVSGSYSFTIVYSGDSNYSPTTSATAYVQVNPAIATLSLTASPTTVTIGQTVNATVTISGNGPTTPTGSINFTLGGTVVSTVPIAGSAVSASFPVNNAGTILAVYAGDSFYGSATSNAVPLKVNAGILQFVPSQAITFAGTPGDDNHYGYPGEGDGGPATSAGFHWPYGVALDNAGNVYISDQQNNEIRRVDATTGIVTNYAGIAHTQSIYYCSYSGDGGQAQYAGFCNPSGMAFDANNNLYIADYGNHIVRRVDATTHIITTVAGIPQSAGYTGNGTARGTHLDNPIGVSFDAAGNMYIADFGNNLVRKVDTSGNITTVAGQLFAYAGGSGANGVPATSVALTQPTAIAFDPSGNMYIAEAENGGSALIREVNSSGIINTVAGGGSGGDGGPATSARLAQPYGLAIDATGALYFPDFAGSVRRVDPVTGIITSVVGNVAAGYPYYINPGGGPSTNFTMEEPQGLALDGAGSIYVVDSLNETVIKAGPQGSMLFPLTAPGSTSIGETLTLTNSGNEPIVFNATPYTVTGNYTVSAAATNPCNFFASLAVGASCNVQVQYAPPAGTNNPQGTIAFNDNALSSPQTVYLKENSTAVATSIALQIDNSPSPVGTAVLLFATVTGSGTGLSPTGTVSFYDGSAFVGSATISNTYGYISVTTFAAGTHTITAVYSGDPNYAGSTSPAGTLVITGSLTVTANNVTRAYDQVNLLTYSINGLPNGVNPPGVTGTPSISTAAVGTSALGTYPITITQGTLAASGDTFTFVNGMLTVSGPSTQSIIFPPIPPLPVGTPFTLTARATSGLPVTYSVTGPATISGNKVTATGTGLVTVTANQSGNADYSAASPVSVSFTP